MDTELRVRSRTIKTTHDGMEKVTRKAKADAPRHAVQEIRLDLRLVYGSSPPSPTLNLF
jgi:hypothetical protein